jgi:hypothetical protein
VFCQLGVLRRELWHNATSVHGSVQLGPQSGRSRKGPALLTHAVDHGDAVYTFIEQTPAAVDFHDVADSENG